jgi:site-specific recombinase XerD
MKILFINGAEIVMVSKLMGHNSLKTTMVYIKILDDTKRAGVELLKFV